MGGSSARQKNKIMGGSCHTLGRIYTTPDFKMPHVKRHQTHFTERTKRVNHNLRLERNKLEHFGLKVNFMCLWMDAYICICKKELIKLFYTDNNSRSISTAVDV